MDKLTLEVLAVSDPWMRLIISGSFPSSPDPRNWQHLHSDCDPIHASCALERLRPHLDQPARPNSSQFFLRTLEAIHIPSDPSWSCGPACIICNGYSDKER